MVPRTGRNQLCGRLLRMYRRPRGFALQSTSSARAGPTGRGGAATSLRIGKLLPGPRQELEASSCAFEDGRDFLVDLVPFVQHGSAIFEALDASSDFLAPSGLDFLRRGYTFRAGKLSDDKRSILRVELERFFENLFDRPAHLGSLPQGPPPCTPPANRAPKGEHHDPEESTLQNAEHREHRSNVRELLIHIGDL